MAIVSPRIPSDAQSKTMQRIYNRTTPEEQRWIVRIILKGAALVSL